MKNDLHLASSRASGAGTIISVKDRDISPHLFPQAYYLLICTTSKEDEESKPGLKEEWIA
jgi:hypothetical protein